MRKVVVGIIIASLMGCSMGHRDPVEIKQELNDAVNNANSRSLDELPASVQADLMPELDTRSDGEVTSLKRFRVQADGVEARTFFASIISGTEYSAVIHPNVTGQITVNLSDVTLDEVLDVTRDMYGYDVIKNGKIIQVYPAGMRTETLPVDYLQLTRNGRSLTTITTSTVSTKDDDNSNNDSNSSSSNSSDSSDSTSNTTGGTTIETVSQSDFWTQLQVAVEGLIGTEDGRSVVVNPQAGVITVRAQPSEIRDIKQFLSISHERLQRQVILEAKILEVTLSDGYQQGINWSNIGASIGSGSIDIARTAISTALPGQDAIGELLGGQTNVTISDGNFEAVLSFMSTQGDLNVLSSPRVTAANNQKAVIKVGVDEYFVTGVSIDYIDVNDTTTPTTEYELTSFFSGISLDVTPQIDGSGNVLLHVHPAVIDVEEKTFEFLNDAPMARSSIRESDSIIRARDGDVVVIGGLMKSNTFDKVSKVPVLGDIPALGHLFRNTTEYTEKTELVILLKPTIVGVHTWQKEVERSRDLLQEWFPDSE
jgi:MSHA biogenesis protein MshL